MQRNALTHREHQFVQFAAIDQGNPLFQGRGIALLPWPCVAQGANRSMPGGYRDALHLLGWGLEAFVQPPQRFHQCTHITAVMGSPMNPQPTLAAVAA